MGFREKRKKARNKHQASSRNAKGPSLGARWREFDWGRLFIFCVGAGFFLIWCFLWGRFYTLQVIKGPEYAERAERQQRTGETRSGLRGAIFDRNGNVLAGSVEIPSLAARPAEIQDIPKTAAFLAKTLGLPEKKLTETLKSKKNFVWIQRKISDRKATEIAGASIPGLELHREHQRFYPYKHLAGQLIGFVGMDNIGLEGLEAAFEDRLSGNNLRRTVRRDAGGRRIYMDGRSDMDDLRGQSLSLTIDAQVQFFAETAIAQAVLENNASWGGCMVVEVKSGDILAWAQYPFVNPNAYGSFTAQQRRNRLAMDALEQGSTVKPFAIAAALEEKIVKRETMFNCENGKWSLSDKIIRDTRPHKELSVEQILRYSSNIGVGKIGLAMGSRTYGRYLGKLGFGKRTGIGIMGESPGIMRTPSKWGEVDLASASFGQSFSATTLQMAQAYLCLANLGEKKSLQLFKDKDLRKPEGKEAGRIFSVATSREMLSMLKNVVQADDGGGRFARIPGLEIGGKTGTAQKAEKGVYGDKRTASFVGLAPAESPEFLVLVVVDEPLKQHYGSAVATPVFRSVMTETMAYAGLLPDPNASTGLELAQSGLDPAELALVRAKADIEARTRMVQGEYGRKEVRVSLEAGADTPNAPLVPDVRGLSVRQAVEVFAVNGMVPSIVGQGETVERQSPQPGTPWPQGSQSYGEECVLWLKEQPL